jgi:hypothetical protein
MADSSIFSSNKQRLPSANVRGCPFSVNEWKNTLLSDTRAISARVDTVEKQLATLTTVHTDAAIGAQMVSVQKSVEDVSLRMNKLEQVIIQDPAKALEMPLLRNQLETVKSGYQSDMLAVRQEIAQVYDLTKWFLGLMFTMALGIIGLAVTNFVKAGAKERGEPPATDQNS